MDGSPEADDRMQASAKLKSQGSIRRARDKDKELERRRSRGEISCAECRRLKLRCDKKVPCATCIRRGCHSICPNGLLTSGQGSRLVLANTAQLHGKLLQMSQRIRQLEDALQIAHSGVSKEIHPLLSEELLPIKSTVDWLPNDGADKQEEGTDEEMTTALGTLAISECGATRFIGRIAADALLVEDELQAEEATNLSQAMTSSYLDVHDQLPDLLVDAAKDFPLQYRNVSSDKLFKLISERLPTYERATALVEAYLGNLLLHPKPIERGQIMETLLPHLYKARYPDVANSHDMDGKIKGTMKMHNLALALALFACGAAADLTQEPDNQEGKLYCVLSLTALNGHSIVGPGGASLETVQAVALIAQYHFISGDPASMEASWKIFAFALIIAASIGLHRDPAHWNMEPKYIERRRLVFWDIFYMDKWKSLRTGRPSCFHIQEVDCEFPEDKETFVDDNGKYHEGPNRWRYRLVKHIIGPLSEHLLLAKPIKYSEILDWDRKLRDFDDPPILSSSTVSDPVEEVRRRMWATHKQTAILSIHSNFFARAMMKYSGNPLGSPFVPSFLAAYASSIKLLRNTRVCYDISPGCTLRLWPMWTHCLTSSVVLGSVASNAGQPQLASAALQDLDLAIRLFEDAQKHFVCRQGLPILIRLRERACRVMQNLAQQNAVPSGVIVSKTEQDETDELAALRGTTRLLRGKRTHKSLSPVDIERKVATESRESGHASLPSPVLAMESDATVRNVPDGLLFTSPTMATSGPSSTNPNQAQFPYRPTSDPIPQDIASLFNTLYNDPSISLDPVLLTASPDLNDFDTFGQQQLQSSNQQPPHYGSNATNPQTVELNNAGSAAAFPSDSCLDEAAQLDSMFSETYLDSNSNLDTAQSAGNASMPPFDLFSWLSSSTEPEAPSQFSGNTAQFMEDWRFQAAIQGGHFLTEPDEDSRMTNLP